MRVRVWIAGPEGPSHDFELVEAPRVGENVTISISGETLEGDVQSVSWHLQGVDRTAGDLALEGEPVGSVTIVHVVCQPKNPTLRMMSEAAETPQPQQAH